jgi:hypothetical protein
MATPAPDFAEPVLGRREAPIRVLNPATVLRMATPAPDFASLNPGYGAALWCRAMVPRLIFFFR